MFFKREKLINKKTGEYIVIDSLDSIDVNKKDWVMVDLFNYPVFDVVDYHVGNIFDGEFKPNPKIIESRNVSKGLGSYMEWMEVYGLMNRFDKSYHEIEESKIINETENYFLKDDGYIFNKNEWVKMDEYNYPLFDVNECQVGAIVDNEYYPLPHDVLNIQKSKFVNKLTIWGSRKGSTSVFEFEDDVLDELYKGIELYFTNLKEGKFYVFRNERFELMPMDCYALIYDLDNNDVLKLTENEIFEVFRKCK